MPRAGPIARDVRRRRKREQRAPTGDWTDSPDNWGDEAWRLFDDALEELLPAAEQAAAILALEGYVKNVVKTQSQLLDLLERFPTQHLQVVCDPYNYLSRHLLPAQERATGELLDRSRTASSSRT